MEEIIAIAGSPSERSRSSAILGYARNILGTYGFNVTTIHVRDLPAEDLIYGRFDSPAIHAAAGLIQAARGVIIATPIYKAAYSGVLKVFLDLLPQKAFAGKLVLPIATGGSPLHMLAIDYALRPVVTALGGQHIMQGVYVVDSQIQWNGQSLQLAPEAEQRLDAAVSYLVDEVGRTLHTSMVGSL